jgi:hypothetical protein
MFLKNLFKKKKLKFTGYTYYEFSQRLFPIQSAKKMLPPTFGEVPMYHSGGDKITCPYTKLTQAIPFTKTIRHCDGILDLWGNSMIVCAPFDLAINVKDNKVTFQTPEPESLKVVQHNPAQYDKMFPDYVNLKFVCPWKIFSNKSVNCMFTPAFYHFDKDLRESVIIPPGVVNYVNGADVNINFFVKKQFLQKIIHIKAGTPLVYITPMTSESYTIDTELQSREMWESTHSGFFAFKSWYKQYKQNIRKENLDN